MWCGQLLSFLLQPGTATSTHRFDFDFIIIHQLTMASMSEKVQPVTEVHVDGLVVCLCVCFADENLIMKLIVLGTLANCETL